MTAEAMSQSPQRPLRRPVPVQEVRPVAAAPSVAPVRQVAAARRPVPVKARPDKAWWFSIPSVAMACARVVLFPLAVVTKAAELAMAAVVLGIVGIGFLWWTGRVTDMQIVQILQPLGDRILSMVQSSGAL